jgi:hypothetical protein
MVIGVGKPRCFYSLWAHISNCYQSRLPKVVFLFLGNRVSCDRVDSAKNEYKIVMVIVHNFTMANKENCEIVKLQVDTAQAVQ